MGKGRWIVVAGLAGLLACGGGEDDEPKTEPDITADAGVADDVVAVDTPSTVDSGPIDKPDAAEPDCAARCGDFAGCYLDLLPEECLEICEQAESRPKDFACLKSSIGCKELVGCLDIGAKVTTPFAAGPYGTEPRQTAGPFQVRTARGFYSFQERWTGDYTYFFIVRSGGYPYTENMWKAPLEPLLENAPANAHFFFVAMRDEDKTDNHEAHVLEMKARWDDALTKVAKADRRKWRKRVHFVLDRMPMPGEQVGAKGFADGWLGQVGEEQGRFCFAIDRRQKTRECGNVAWPPTGTAAIQSLSTLSFLGRHFDFEVFRDAQVAKQSVTEVAFTKGKKTYSEMVRYVDFPSAAEMADFNRLAVDLSITCEGHRGRNCAGMHEMIQLHLCDLPSASTPVHGETPCEQEIARWSVASGAEGRWITDITPALALLSAGGTRRLRLFTPSQKRTVSGNTFDVKFIIDLRFRLSAEGDKLRPFASQLLWGDPAATFEPFDAAYNSRHKPTKLLPPDGWKKAELHALITGHGWGQVTKNCAIFCDHSHHLNVGGKSYSKGHPEAGSTTGCSDLAGKGVVPNQSNAWRNGRSGWCPGKDVVPWVVDITEGVKASSDGMLSYEARVDGQPYAPKPSATPNPAGAQPTLLRTLRVVWWK